MQTVGELLQQIVSAAATIESRAAGAAHSLALLAEQMDTTEMLESAAAAAVVPDQARQIQRLARQAMERFHRLGEDQAKAAVTTEAAGA
jgi:hypothetical protein